MNILGCRQMLQGHRGTQFEHIFRCNVAAAGRMYLDMDEYLLINSNPTQLNGVQIVVYTPPPTTNYLLLLFKSAQSSEHNIK